MQSGECEEMITAWQENVWDMLTTELFKTNEGKRKSEIGRILLHCSEESKASHRIRSDLLENKHMHTDAKTDNFLLT